MTSKTIREWLDWLAMDKSATTVRQYGWHVRRLPDKPPRDFTTADLTAHLARLREAGNSPAALKQSLAAIKSYFAYHCKRRNPAKSIPWPKVRGREQRTPTLSHFEQLLTTCDTSTPKGVRDLALLTLMGSTGLRAAEVCRLRLADVDLEQRKLRVVIKGGSERRARFGDSTAAYLARWIAAREAIAQPGVAEVFTGLDGTRHGIGLTTDALRSIFRKLGKRAGLPAGFSPHDLRRFLATRAIESGAPSRMVQAAGRWADLGMVEHYSAAIGLDAFDQWDPVERVIRGQGGDRPGPKETHPPAA